VIRFACPMCQAVTKTADDQAGGTVFCHSCGQKLEVPRPTRVPIIKGQLLPPEEPTELAPESFTAAPPPIRRPIAAPVPVINCPCCHEPLQLTPDMHGCWVSCPKCGNGFAAMPEESYRQPTYHDDADYSGGLTVNVNVDTNSGGGAGLAASLGIGSMLIGSLGFLACWVPLVGLFLGTVGIGLAVGGMVAGAKRNWAGIGFAIAGLALSIISFGFGAYLLFKLAALENSFRTQSALELKQTAHRRATTIANAAQIYATDHNGTLPASPQLLTRRDEYGGPYVEAGELVDPWRNPYQYDPSGQHSAGVKPDVWTTAPDGTVVGSW